MMRTLFFITAALFFSACTKKEKPEGNVHIYGKVAGLKQGAIVIRNDENTKTLDSISISGDESFESHFTLETPQMLHIYLNRGVSNNIDNSLDLFAEPGDIRIETTLDRFYADAKITGSKNHEKYTEFKKINQRYTDQHLELTKKRFEAFKNKTVFDEATAAAEVEKIETRRYLAAINFALNNKDLDVAPFIALTEVGRANLKLLDTVASALPPKVRTAKYGKMLDEFIAMRKAAENQTEK